MDSCQEGLAVKIRGEFRWKSEKVLGFIVWDNMVQTVL